MTRKVIKISRRNSRRQFLATALTSTAALGFASRARAETALHYDVIVVGVGSGGFGAGYAAARAGLKVLLLEIADEIGGNAVRGGVSHWEPGVGGTGIPFDIYTRLKPIENAVGIYGFGRHFSWDGRDAFPGGEHIIYPDACYADTLQRHRPDGKPVDVAWRKAHWHGVVFEPADYQRAMGDMLEETGNATVRMGTTFDRVSHREGRIQSLVLTGGQAVTADAYIDCTGHGALCQACGCEVMRGQESRHRFGEPGAPEQSNNLLNGVTLMFRVKPAEARMVQPLPADIPSACWWGNFPAMSAVRFPNGDYSCNMLPTMAGKEYVRLGHKAAYGECLRRVRAFWRHVQSGWPEFQDYRIAWVAPDLGIRETSRIVTDYVLREQDILAGLDAQAHDDIIAIADHSFDRHGAGGGGGEVKAPYGVPYRCLIPKGMKNLLIACRGAGFSSIASSSCRLSRTMMQLGQAAGTAAVVAQSQGAVLPEVSPDALRNALEAQQVQLAFPLSDGLRTHLGNA